MLKYLVAGGAFALVLAITQAAPAEAAVSSPAAPRLALASGNASDTFVLASTDLATVGAAPREDGTDSGDDGSDGGDDSGQ
jgi:ketopantoate hydroxymethyltransferase